MGFAMPGETSPNDQITGLWIVVLIKMLVTLCDLRITCAAELALFAGSVALGWHSGAG